MVSKWLWYGDWSNYSDFLQSNEISYYKATIFRKFTPYIDQHTDNLLEQN